MQNFRGCLLKELIKRQTPSIQQARGAKVKKFFRGSDIYYNRSSRGYIYEFRRSILAFDVKAMARAAWSRLGYTAEISKTRLFEEPPVSVPFHGAYDYFWKFDSEESFKNWIVTADRDNEEGMSKAYLKLSKNKKALFFGNLDTTVPQDGDLKRTGYCSIRSPKNESGIPLLRRRYYNWNGYTHLVIRCRGDGRPYYLGISADHGYLSKADSALTDVYNYPLFTRGGPYWQIVKIPFTKFFFTTHGRLQDYQQAFKAKNVKSVFISIMDDVSGPFQLEIDYIALVRDETTGTEKCYYEMYS